MNLYKLSTLRFVLLTTSFYLLLSSCSPKIRVSSGYTETGYGTYYGKEFHGRKTASGERFDMYALTAAHRKLPFGTKCLVTNLSNGKSIVVRINDRGPWVQGGIIDLSYEAARRIDLLKMGKVKITVLNKEGIEK